MVVREFKERIWWPRCEERLREITQESYECAWHNWIEPEFADTELEEITARVLDAWLQDKEVTAGVWRIMKAMLRMAFKYELISHDPCAQVLNVPEKGEAESATLTHDEMVTLMDGLADTEVLLRGGVQLHDGTEA